MIELPTVADLLRIEVAAPLVVVIGILIRVYAGSILFHPRYTILWNTLRRIFVPILNRVTLARFGVNIENAAVEDEYVATLPDSVADVVTELDTVAALEVPLLAGFKTDWEGRTEAGTVCIYHGPRPFPTAPDWLRDRQTHLTFFRDADGRTVVTAHEEANSYRPDQWADHLFARSLNREKGVEHTTLLLQECGLLESDVATESPE